MQVLSLLVLALLLSSALSAQVFQLDVCNKHRTVSEAPGTSLTVTKDGLCVVTSQVLTVPAGAPRSCSASKSSTAVLLRFPCKEEPRLKQASGPALNVWGSFEGVPQPTRSGMIVTESAPVRKQSLHAAKLAGSSSSSSGGGGGGAKPSGYVVSTTGSSSSSSGSPDGYVVGTTTAASQPSGYVVTGANAPSGYVVSTQGSSANAPNGYVVSTTGANAPSGYVVSATNTPNVNNPSGYVVGTQGSGASIPSGYVVSTQGRASNSTGGSCSFLTLNPGLYYHKSPPMFTYGYTVSGVPCERAQSALSATNALDRAGARTFPTTYSLWLKPSLPAPPAGLSTEPQSCHLVVSVLQLSYVSLDTFPCSMRTLAPEELDDGCCYNAGGGMGRRLLHSLWGGRSPLSSWEKGVWSRRAMLH